jgi:hypothetical protein
MRMRVFGRGVLCFLMAASVSGQAKTPPETRNAALRYWMAFAEIKDPPADKATQDLLEETVAGVATWDEARLGSILDANADAIAIFQRATKLPDCDWGIEYSRGPRASIAYAPRARVLARLNTLQGMREMAKGQSQEAADAWLAGMRFTGHLAKGGSLIFALIAKSTLLPNLHALMAEVKQGHLNASQKQQITSALMTLPEDGFDWSRAWEIEEVSGEHFLAEVQRSPSPVATYSELMGKPESTNCVPPTAQEVQAYRDYMNEVSTALRLAPPTTKRRLLELDSKAKDICEPIRNLIPSPQRVNDARVEIMTARKELLDALSAK